MPNASFAQIKALQARTGKKMKECKDALNQCDCDEEKAAALEEARKVSRRVHHLARPCAYHLISLVCRCICSHLPCLSTGEPARLPRDAREEDAGGRAR